MKKLFLLLPLLILAVACDAPQRVRTPSLYSNSYTSDPTTTSGASSGLVTVPTGTTGTSSGGTTTPATGFENCVMSNKYQNIDVGFFDLCQSSSDETMIQFKTSLASTSVRICLIPLYRDSTGSSMYLGNPQCTYTQANTLVQGRLYKDRSGASSYPINAVMVMKENLTPEYYSCMQAYTNWPSNSCSTMGNTYCSYWASVCPYGGANQTGSNCDVQAKSYMSQVCNSFISKYSNAYTEVQTK